MANGGDIIIKGGSVDIDYDDNVYKKESTKPRNHLAKDQAITRVTVEDVGGGSKYDSDTESGADPSRWKVTVYCEQVAVSE
jgi:hypothetical protein